MRKHWIILSAGLSLALSTMAADWPQFCGPTRNNISEETGLADTWPESGPKILWETEVYDGYAGPAVKGGKVYQIDRENEDSILRCLDLAKGEELWRCAFKDPGTMEHKKYAGTRGTPTVTDEAVYLVTGYGTMACIDLESKSIRWKHNLLEEFGMSLNRWGMTQGPCLYKDLVIVTPAAKSAGVVAFNQKTGELVWKTDSIGGYTFASPAVYNICGEDMVVALGSQEGQQRGRRGAETENQNEAAVSSGTYGISPKDGSVLWFYAGWQGRNAIPFPIQVPGNRLFITGGYNAGSAMIRIDKTDEGYTVAELLKTDDVGPQLHQPIYLQECILSANNGGGNNDGLTCMKLDGTVAWRTKDIEGAPIFELGSFILVDDKIVILDGKSGELYLVKADVSGYHQLASAPIVESNEMAWAPLALSDGKLLVRDWNTLKCVELK